MLDSLTDGLLGSFLGVVGAFGAAWLAIRHDRHQRRREEHAIAVRQASDLRHRVASVAIPMLQALETEIRWGPFLSGRLSRTYLDAMTRIQMEAATLHPEVSTWMLEQFAGVHREALAVRRVCLIPIVRRRAVQKLAAHVAAIVGPLVNWAAGVTDDDWFAQPANRPSIAPSPVA